jgi:hypothetical protein
MHRDPAVRDRKATQLPASVFVVVSLAKPGALRSHQVRDGIRQPSTGTVCALRYRSSRRQSRLRGQFGKGARRRQAWLSQVWSTRSPQPFHKPKCPNCNEGESENPSARKESCCITCGHNILRCPRLSVSVNWGHPHDSIIIQGATSHASGAEITKLLRRPPVPIFLRRERYRTLGNRREATGSVVTEPVCASGSECRGQFCSQRSEYCRSRDRNLSGSGEWAIVFEFHLGYVIADAIGTPLGLRGTSCCGEARQ